MPGTPKAGDADSNHSGTPEIQEIEEEEVVLVSRPIQLEESQGMDTSRAQANDFDGSFLKVGEFEDQSKTLSDNDDDCLIRPRDDPILEESASSFVG